MSRLVKNELIEKTLNTIKACEEAKNKVWNFKVKDFIIDNKTFNFTHPTWKGIWCKGGNSRLETLVLIKKYCKECKQSLNKRKFEFLHLAED